MPDAPVPAPGGARLSAGQMLGWGVAFALIAALIVLFVLHATSVAPLLVGAGS